MRRGFTLAEILITIGIIGVVAAITIPNLISNYQKKVTAQQLKKSFAIFQNVIRMSEADNGDYTIWPGLPYINGPTTTTIITLYDNYINKYYAPYIDISERKTRKGITAVGGTFVYYINDGFPWYYLKDGSCFTVAGPVNSHAYFRIIYDFNGDAPPNRYGRDIFVFSAYKPVFCGGAHSLKFGSAWGTEPYVKKQDIKNDCDKNNSDYFAGTACGALIQENNWKIPDDYPW